jgi:hypothetical protein
MTAAVSPDCRAGKCKACSGDAWDEAADVLTTCRCDCHADTLKEAITVTEAADANAHGATTKSEGPDMIHLTELRFPRGVPMDTQTVHRTILHALDGADAGRVLWCNPTCGVLIVQAPAPVRASRIGGVTESHSGQIRTRWDVGTAVLVSLIANPVLSLSAGPGVRGKRAPLPIEEHEEWLRRKLEAAVDLAEVAVQPLGSRTGRRHESVVTHRLTAFFASGTVVDTDALESLIISGVGPGKAYGAGLLLVSAA